MSNIYFGWQYRACTLGSSLVAFAKLRKATISFVMPVRPSDRPSVRVSAWNNSAPSGLIFNKADIWVFFENKSRHFKFYWNRARITGTLAWRPIRIFLSYLSQFLLKWKMFQSEVAEKIETHLVRSKTFLFLKIVPPLSYCFERGRSQMTKDSCAFHAGYLGLQIHSKAA